MVGIHVNEKVDDQAKQVSPDGKMAANPLLRCSMCGKMIKPGERYTKGFMTGKLACFRCDDGLLIQGDSLIALDE